MKKYLIKNSVLRDFIKKNLFGFLLFSLGIISFILVIKTNDNEIKRLTKEYPDLLLKDNVSCLVLKKYSLDEVVKIRFSIIRDSPYGIFLKLSDDRKFYISTRPSVNKYKIDKIIEKGDSIIKHKRSDTIYVYKKYSDLKKYDYFFIIDTIQY